MVEANSTAESTGTGDSGRSQVYAASNVVNEFSIEDAKALSKPTDRILCTLADNTYIRFGEYEVRDYDSRTQLLHVTAETNKQQDDFARQMEEDGQLTMEMRTLRHDFSRMFF